MESIIDIANNTLKELHEQRQIIDGAIETQEQIAGIYEKCQNILKSMNDSFYRLFLFKKEKLPEKNKTTTTENDLSLSASNELELLKQINIQIGKELDLHNFKLNEALKQKPMPL
jgi:hypothetical protein